MRIVHLSDLHLRQALPGSAQIARRRSRLMPAVLTGALAHMRDMRPDVMVCTGDLLDYPLESLDDLRVQDLARRDLAAIAQVFGDIGCPYLVIPGNHDHPQLTREVFQDVPRDVVVGGVRFIVLDDREGEGHVPRRIGRERRRFEEALLDTTGTPQVHVQHYLVWPTLNEGYPHTYVDGEDLTERVVQSGLVRLVLSGHYHLGVEPQRLGDTWFATVPAICEEPYPLWVYDLDGHHLRWHAVEVPVNQASDGA